jgi:prepilin-type N-terminal cleavage/methylation domain-containing protein
MRTAKGYSLIELMIAIGIMGVGLVMAAALFPAGIRETELSRNDTLGTMIADNGVALLKAKLRHPVSGISSSLAPICTTNVAGNDQRLMHLVPMPGSDGVQSPTVSSTDWVSGASYAVGDIVREVNSNDMRLSRYYRCVVAATSSTVPPSTISGTKFFAQVSRAALEQRSGMAVLGRQIGSGNDYQFVITSYTLADPGNKAVWVQVSGVSFGTRTATFPAGSALRRGTPVVLSDGSFATAVGVADDVATLSGTLSGSGSVWVLVEQDSAGNNMSGVSPAMATVVIRTPLRPS